LARTPIIIDCDPGQDDAINLFLAFASPFEVELLGITTVSGNCALELAQRNARMICEMCGRFAVPVFAGCDRPLVVRPIRAEHVHGASGIDGVEVFEPTVPLQAMHAADFIVDRVRNRGARKITILATAPLTNIAVALKKAPDIVDGVERIILMGGAMREGGNITPSAEFNMRVDPHAAQAVFSSGLEVVALGLDVTHRLLANRRRLEAISSVGNPIAQATRSMLAYSERFDTAKYGTDGAPLHDPVTMAYLLQPGLFETKRVSIRVETAPSLSIGHSAVDYWGVTSDERNVAWAVSVDADGFFELLRTRLAAFGSCALERRLNATYRNRGLA